MSPYRSAPDPYAPGPLVVPQEPDWFERAACRGMGLYLFFGPAADDEKTETPGEKEAREGRAKAVCAGCSVQRECADYENRFAEPIQRGGVWHGGNHYERQCDHRKRLRRAADQRARQQRQQERQAP